MIKDYKIVTLCGSTRFKEQFIETQKKLTLDGCIVISVGLFGHSGVLHRCAGLRDRRIQGGPAEKGACRGL